MSLTAEELKMIGGSDAAALAGVHPYKRPIDVWRRIVEGYDTPDNAAMKRGRRLEPIIREMFAEETGLTLLGPRTFRSPKFDWLRASLDDVAKVDGEEQVVEFKSVNARAAQRYGDGPDDLPEEHICQVQFYLGVSGWHLAHLAALIGGDELKHYRLLADKELQSVLFDACSRFWKDYVLTKRPPPVDGSESYGEWIAKHFAQERAPIVTADERVEQLMVAYRQACNDFDATEDRRRALRQQLEVIIGDAAGVEGNCGKISWRRSKDGTRVDWQGVAANLNPPETLVQKFTVAKPGPRVFKSTWKKVAE